MKKTVIFFQPKFWPGPLNNEKPLRKKYYHGVRETFRYFPLGLLSIGSALQESGDYDVRIIDERFDDWRGIVTGLLADSDVLFVGVTGCTGFEISGGLDFSRLVRQNAPDVPIVWGGWHASSVPEETVSSDLVDIVVRGQGERTIVELAQRLESGSRDLAGIDGLTYRNPEGNIVSEPDRDIVPADDLPPTDYSLVDIARYLKFKDGTPARLFYMSSIGCPFNCSFCSIASVYQRHWSSKNPERVISEISGFVNDYGIESVEFDGTIFFANTKWAKSMLRALIDSGLKLDYVTSTRADIIVKWDDEMKDLIRRSGFKAIGVGAESGSQRMLDIIDKKIKVENITDSLKVLKELGIDPAYTFMFGIPGETIDDAHLTLKLMKELKQIMPASRIAGFFYHPFPGSKIYREYQKHYNISNLTLEEWADYSFDLKYSESLPLSEDYIDFINKRVQYLDWAYPEDEMGGRLLRRALSRVARIRVDHDRYLLPIEWYLAKSLGKSGRLKDSSSM
ncbi:MAG: B12-binding domain-containing radical SAM protein [Thermoleophilia bacterium]